MDGEAWWATVHGITKSRTQLSDFTHSLPHPLVLEIYPEMVMKPGEAYQNILPGG